MNEPSANETSATLHTVIIETGRMTELADFYSQGLALGPPSSTGDDHLGFPQIRPYLGFDLVDKKRAEYPGPVSLWFEVDDLEAVFDRLVALGGTVKYGPTQKPWGAMLAAVFDPDGNVVGLAQRGTLAH